MSKLHRTVCRATTAIAFCVAVVPALATWHPIIEGDYFPDYDATEAPGSFSVFSAGIYNPTVNFVGDVDWQGDKSDTIHFSIGHPGDAGYSLRQFRVNYWTTPSLTSGNQGLHLLLRPAGSSSQSLMSLDLMANSSCSAALTDDTLHLNSSELYALTFSTIGSSDSGNAAHYFLGLSVTNPVPGPASWVLLLAGAALVACATRRRRSRLGVTRESAACEQRTDIVADAGTHASGVTTRGPQSQYKLRYWPCRAAALMALVLAYPAAFATGGSIVEGPDFDSPNAPPFFDLVAQGIYQPNVVGNLSWQDDKSDTFRFHIGHAGVTGYDLRQFSMTFWTSPHPGSGLHLQLRSLASASQPLLSIDLLADLAGNGSFSDSALALNSGELYALTISTISPADDSAIAVYQLGFTVSNPVPEPASGVLMLSGITLLAFAARRRSRASRPAAGAAFCGG